MVLLVSCVQEAENEQPNILYTVSVSESNSTKVLDSVKVQITDNQLITYTAITDLSGQATFPAIASRTNQIIATKIGYTSADTVHSVISKDSTDEINFAVITFELTSDSALQVTEDILKDSIRVIDSLNAIIQNNYKDSVETKDSLYQNLDSLYKALQQNPTPVVVSSASVLSSSSVVTGALN